MGGAFKEALENDLKNIFFNVQEFAELCELDYDGAVYSVPVVIDKNVLQDRKNNSTDHEAELARRETMVYIRAESLPAIPRKNHYISINGLQYVITESSENKGVYELVCVEYEE